MKLSLDIKTSLSQTLTPQQIQYLKLLQLPLVQLEQQVIQELEQNPMIETIDNDSSVSETGVSFESEFLGPTESPKEEKFDYDYEDDHSDSHFEAKTSIDDEGDPFEFYKMVWQDDSSYSSKSGAQNSDDDDNEPFQIKDNVSFIEELTQQLRLLHLSEEHFFLGEQILGNIDSDGYLRRDLSEIVDETNKFIAEINIKAQKLFENYTEVTETKTNDEVINPARQFAIDDSVLEIAKVNNRNHNPIVESQPALDVEDNLPEKHQPKYLSLVNIHDAETILNMIQKLEPPGIGSRTIQECLLSQCKAIPKPNAAQKLAIEILESQYDAFAMKHYHVITKQLEVTESYLKEALEFIRTLNPKPGGGDFQSEINTVIPDFIVEREEDTDELLISVNDSRIPALRLSSAYEKIKKEAKYKVFNKETREWIRTKYDEAKFLIQAIRQRRNTMLKVMTAIAGLQRAFFEKGPDFLRPLIYKDIAENTGLDISTVCRIVNGKYVQTEYGTFELKYFFSESLPSEDGEEISTTVIKNIIKEIIDEEPKRKPYSDDKICKVLKDKGYNVARRTVAKYREQLKIPVARLRKEL